MSFNRIFTYHVVINCQSPSTFFCIRYSILKGSHGKNRFCFFCIFLCQIVYYMLSFIAFNFSRLLLLPWLLWDAKICLDDNNRVMQISISLGVALKSCADLLQIQIGCEESVPGGSGLLVKDICCATCSPREQNINRIVFFFSF